MYSLESQRDTQRSRDKHTELFHLLAHTLGVHSHKEWGKLKPGARSSVWISQTVAASQLLEWAFTVSQEAQHQKAGAGSRSGI